MIDIFNCSISLVFFHYKNKLPERFQKCETGTAACEPTGLLGCVRFAVHLYSCSTSDYSDSVLFLHRIAINILREH